MNRCFTCAKPNAEYSNGIIEQMLGFKVYFCKEHFNAIMNDIREGMKSGVE